MLAIYRKQRGTFSGYGLEEVTLPRPFNEDEAFRLSIEQLTDTVMWYRKHFRLPAGSKNKKVFVEFEGVRQGADFLYQWRIYRLA